MKNCKMFGILCESDIGLDAFGNPKGKPILMESVGDGLDYALTMDRAEAFRSAGKYGRVIVVELVINEVLF